MRNKLIFALIILAVAVGAVGVYYWYQNQRTGSAEYNPTTNPADFGSVVDNPYYMLVPGTTFTYQSETPEGTENNIVIVTDKTKEILGITAIEVWDRVWLDDELIEETYDWYAQDKEGNVWYLGEDSKEYDNGKVTSTLGSWEAGIDGAKPGIIMEANPKVGDSYRQEYFQGSAEDMGDVISLGKTVSISYGTFDNCLQTRDWSKIDSALNEYKYYCPEIGTLALEEEVNGQGKTELTSVSKP
ncbi:hypothetical protein A2V54_00970 [candidate division WWE3 bacterium RBG_19FT_COMBO_53_11]|uniref:Uncharacterized protein n=1 Tax=candidate division WWE3 bacterium RBG_19FT_COMBO_53_11 TaxID=1802613 RepID=A0A1F4UIJ5_UNCKA|nr:MAG: hypothetical protein A2155_00260 [candidate division WWE3 bacterium RBG_16_52_45]OGC44737.1 MAG: hypothetical protein A2V54_00970 [candidate division WWE3 bacterium RBG_19FT_COMBO_53_11]